MDHFQKLKGQIQIGILSGMVAVVLLSAAVYFSLTILVSLDPALAALITAAPALIFAAIISQIIASETLKPTEAIWQAVLHVDPDHHTTAAPNLEKLRIGRELVTNLVLQIYQFASQENGKDLVEHRQEIIQAANVVNHLPLPLFVFNKQLLVTNASNTALEYCSIESSELFGRSLFDNLKLEFPSELTLDAWVKDCQDNKVTDTAYWERVHVLSKEDSSVIKQCDIAAYYNRDNASGAEFIVTLFDRTDRYNQDDDALSFVALAVHELRTPITMLRGYIEVFEDELSDQLDDELKSFMTKMEIAAKHLSSFVGNILNVARIDQNQLSLHLTEESWPEVLKTSISDAEIRAKIHGKNMEVKIEDGIAPVAVDQVSIYEVMNNLLENAIKYSNEGSTIVITTGMNKAGLIETTIKDAGPGIPVSVLPNLFEKFSRNHRTRSQVSGTGLGLYLSKAIVTAHSGQIWASSKEGEGSTFGFTLQPYANLAKELDGNENKEITRNAHGWIKNHSLYRR